MNDVGEWKIAHMFADSGVESEYLDEYGTVYRFTLNPRDTNNSIPIKADIRDLPVKDSFEFDLTLSHPPCGFVSPLSDTKGGNSDDWPNLIPEAREAAKKHSKYYIIENKSQAKEHMDDPVILNGGMFGLPFEYERAFETNFPVKQPPRQRTFGDTRGQPFFSSEHSKAWWSTAKGYTNRYNKNHIAKNAVPRAYLQHIMLNLLEHIDNEDRPDYSNYDNEMDAKRARAANKPLVDFT